MNESDQLRRVAADDAVARICQVGRTREMARDGAGWREVVVRDGAHLEEARIRAEGLRHDAVDVTKSEVAPAVVGLAEVLHATEAHLTIDA